LFVQKITLNAVSDFDEIFGRVWSSPKKSFGGSLVHNLDLQIFKGYTITHTHTLMYVLIDMDAFQLHVPGGSRLPAVFIVTQKL